MEVIVTVKDTGASGIDPEIFQGYVQCLSQSQMKILA